MLHKNSFADIFLSLYARSYWEDGALIKPYVAIVGAVALTHLRPIKKIVPLILAGVISAAIILSPLAIKNPTMLKATLDSILTRSAWSSPYALIDDVYTP